MRPQRSVESGLSPDESEALAQQGFFVLRGAHPEARLERLRAAFETAMPSTASGTRHSDDLAARDPILLLASELPKIIVAVREVLERPFRLLQLAGRDPLPGFGQQGLHTDWLPRAPSDPFAVVTALTLLDDFTVSNGATRVVPGSHRLARPLPKSMQAPEARHPDETLVIADAGSVIVFNGHLWHSGTRNRSRASRRVIQCQYVAEELAPSWSEPTVGAGPSSPAGS